MATKRELAAECAEIADRIGVVANTSGMNVNDLTSYLDELRALEAERSPVSAVKATEAEVLPAFPDVEPEPDPTAKATVYVVAPKRSVTSLRGVITGEVSARDFAGGEDSLRALIASGTVIER